MAAAIISVLVALVLWGVMAEEPKTGGNMASPTISQDRMTVKDWIIGLVGLTVFLGGLFLVAT